MDEYYSDPSGRRRGHRSSSPYAGYHPAPKYWPGYPRDVAMNRDRSSHGDDRRDRGRSERGSRRPPSDFQPPRSRSPSPFPRRPQGFRDRDYQRDERFHETQHKRHRDISRDFGPSRDHIRGGEEPSGWDRRAKEPDYDKALHPHYEGEPRNRESASRVPRVRSRSPSALGKRRRSLSPLPFPPLNPSKKSRRERSRNRAEKRRSKKSGHSRHPRESSPYRRRSPSPYQDRPRRPIKPRSERPDLFENHQLRVRGRSPSPREADVERGPPVLRQHPQTHPPSHADQDSHLRNPSRSPLPISRRSSYSRAHSPSLPSRTRLAPSEAGSISRRSSPTFEPPRHNQPPRSPRGDHPPAAPSGLRKKGKRRDDARFSKRVEPSSGANSIEVNMSRRDNFRSSFGAQMPPAYPAKHFNDPRYNQSPPHVTPGSSYHGSPAQSPYGANGRGGWNGSHQYSPHGQYPPQHSQGTFAPPTGPQAQFHQNQSPPLPPTGPANPQGRGFSRGGFRGGNINPARGGSRGGSNLKSSPFGAPTGPAASRSHLNHSGESTPQHASPHHTASNHSEPASVKEGSGGDENPFRPSKDLQVEDSTPEKKDDEQMPPPTTRAPPTGPAAGTSGSKFSFAFKATSKAPVAAPKPEISQKFSAAPPRRDPQPVDDRSNRDRDLPRGVPTEPASSRARSEQQHNRHHLPETPRTRKVKKIERRLKPKPQLPPDLATSDSVFFRKPGNESVVGSGTYGKVFKGLHVYTKRLVALKKIRMEGERDGFPVTAVREIKLLQSLKHLNIVNLQEVMVEKNDCFMVFEYLSHDLTGLLNHPSFKLDAGQKKHLAKQLFEGLDYLHGRGVLHRDIKAANILVSSDGILKIADFGLARFYAKRHQLDYTNRVITIWYRSPELLLGETQYTAAVDVWSAACVLVEIFTRHAIFPGDGTEMSQLERIYAILGTPNKAEWPDVVKMEWFELLRPGYRKPNVFAEKYKERVPASAFELLASMFHYDPAKRPSAAEVLGHAYFTTEQPPPRQAIELADIQGDWHEFESKALRREKEKQDREARKAAGAKDSGHRDRERDKKRSNSSHEAQREPKRPHIESRAASSNKPSASAAAQSGSGASGAVVN